MLQSYNEFNINIGKKIKELRVEKAFSRTLLAARADISAKFLYEIELGKKGCSCYILYRLAVALGVRVDRLIPYDGMEYDAGR